MTDGELRFDDRVALITGAGRGMGRVHALDLARRGAQIVVADRGVALHGTGADPSPAQAVVAEVHAAGGTALAFTGDLTIEAQARDAVRFTLDSFGSIDIVVHNAGFTLGGLAFEDESLDRLDAQLAINTRAAFAIANAAWPHFRRQRYGRMVIVGSTALYGMPRSVPYSTAKSSYIGFMRSLALAGEADGIRVNTILPAAATRMSENMADSDYRRWFLETMRPELVTPVVVALAHERCTISGELLVVGGGRVARTVIIETDGVVDRDLTAEGALDLLPSLVSEPGTWSVPADTAQSGALAARLLGSGVDVTIHMNPAHSADVGSADHRR